MRSVSPIEWGEVLNGKVVDGSRTRNYHAKPGDYDRWLNAFVKSPTADQILESTESSQDFFHIESDLGALIPPEEWQEAFFSLKMGFNVPGVPMQFLYFSKLLFEKYKVCNLIGVMYPNELAFYMGKAGYFSELYTPLDALRSYVYEDFNIVTEADPIVKCGDWYEAYLPIENMVCALPSCIGTMLTRDDVSKIRQIPGRGLVLGGTPIVSLGGLKGVSSSVYDLRQAL